MFSVQHICSLQAAMQILLTHISRPLQLVFSSDLAKARFETRIYIKKKLMIKGNVLHDAII